MVINTKKKGWWTHGVDLRIMDVLSNRACMDRPMNLKQIAFWLNLDFGIRPSRETLSRHVHALEDEGYVLHNRGYYQKPLLSRIQERIIIDSLVYSRLLPAKDLEVLLRSLIPLTSPKRKMFLTNVEYLVDLNRTENDSLYDVLEKADDAIRKDRQLIVTPCYQTIDKIPEEKEEYRFDPYYIISDKCRYYLLGGCEIHGVQLEARRIDRISRVKISRTPRKPIDYYWRYRRKFDIKRYLKEHVYMFPGESARIRMEIMQRRIGDFIDWFGKDYTILRRASDPRGFAEISVESNVDAVFYWALQYSEMARVLAPKALCDRLLKRFIEGAESYGYVF